MTRHLPVKAPDPFNFKTNRVDFSLYTEILDCNLYFETIVYESLLGPVHGLVRCDKRLKSPARHLFPSRHLALIVF